MPVVCFGAPRSRRLTFCSLVACAWLTLTGFMRIDDEVVIGAQGGADVTRRVAIAGAEELEQSLARYNRKDPAAEYARRKNAAELKDLLCGEATKGEKRWDDCRYEGETIVVARHYTAGESPFSSASGGSVSFGLHQYVRNPLTFPPVALPQLSSSWTDGPEYLETIADLKADGLGYRLVLQLPGEIETLWGRPVQDAGSRLELDLLEPWPPEREETFVTASAGILGARYLPLVALSAMGLAVLWWRRRTG